MKIRDLTLRSGTAVVSAWPPQWAGTGTGPWPVGLQGMIVAAEWAPDRRSLRITNRYAGGEHTGTLIVDDPETVLPKVLAVLNAEAPISAQDAEDLDLPS